MRLWIHNVCKVVQSSVINKIVNVTQWQYFTPVQEGMAVNCSKDVSLVIDYIDSVLLHGNASEKYALKAKFGLGPVEHDEDFVA